MTMIRFQTFVLTTAATFQAFLLWHAPSSVLGAEETPHFPYYPVIEAPGHLHVIDRADMNTDEYLMVISLQGVLAQEQPRIYITNSGVQPAYDYWLDKMVAEYGVTTESHSDAIGLLETFKNEVEGYILARRTDPDPDIPGHPELNMATSLAGIKQAIVVTRELQPEVNALGLDMIKNVGRFMEPGSEFDDYKDEYNNNILFTAENFIIEMRDLVIATRGMIHHETEHVEGDFFDETEVYEWVADDSPHMGWGGVNKPAEEDYVGDPGRHGLFTVPANWMMNLSTLLGLRKDQLAQQKVPARSGAPDEAHYLAIIMSDGDNTSFVLQGMADDPKYFASPHRGDFPMNWTMPATLIDLAPAALEWYFENAGGDYFVSGGSGAGYMYPSEYPDLHKHMRRFNDYAGRSDFPYVGMLDFPSMDHPRYHRVASVYAQQPNVKGVISVNFYSYAADAGKMVFVGDTPFVAMRENLWEMNQGQIDQMVQRINGYSKNPADPGAYTIMNVHAWSHDMADVAALVENLDPHVEVVTIKTLFEKVKENVDPEPYSLPEVHFAEFYDDISGAQKEGEIIGFIESGDYVGYRNVDFSSESFKTFSVRASSATQGGEIHLRLDGPDGELVGVVEIDGTGGWGEWQVISAGIAEVGGVRDLYLTFSGDDGFLFNLDWFRIDATKVVAYETDPGVELAFFTEAGTDYVIQATENLGAGSWSDITGPIAGSNEVVRRFFPFEGRQQEYFRVVVD